MTIYKEGPNKKGYEFQSRNIYENPQFIEAVKKYAESGGGLEGTNYVYVAANGTDVENAAELQAAYDEAANLVSFTSSWVNFNIFGAVGFGGGAYEIYFNPSTNFFQSGTTYTIKINGIEYTGFTGFVYGSSAYFLTNAPDGLTITSFEVLDVSVKRATVIAAPGYYNFENTNFKMNQEYVDLVSLDGNRSIIFNSQNALGTISVTADNVFVKGVDVSSNGKSFLIASNQSNLIVENCKGGNNSFGDHVFFNSKTSGTFIDCEGGDYSFGSGLNTLYSSNASGIFINCKGGDYSFGSGGLTTASGTFTNCVGGLFSFASGFGGTTASGLFNNCVGGSYSCGHGADLSGTFNNCIGGQDSWNTNNLTGKIYFCRSTGGQTAPQPSLGGAIVSFIFVNTFIAQNP